MRILFAITLLLSLAAMPGQGATIYWNRATFEAAAGPGTVEGFEAVIDYAFDPPPSATYGAITVTETGANIGAVGNPNKNGLMPQAVTAGSGAVTVHDNGDSLVTFSFATPVSAFGVNVAAYLYYLDDEASIRMKVKVPYTNTGTHHAESSIFAPSTNQPGVARQFFGVINETDTFSSIVFEMEGNRMVGFDEAYYRGPLTGGDPGGDQGGQVPEPATMSLVAVAGLGLVIARRYRR